jgi:MFS transporter
LTVSNQERRHALRFILFLGVVSLFADMTYEGARSIVGPFLQSLGANATEVGIIAGFGEMIAASLRFFSGKLVDRTRAYWLMAFLGYFMNLVAVPTLAFAGNWQLAALLVIAERTGKGLRGPAVDVLLSGATVKVGHGWGFGLHTALDQTGAVLGPLIVVAMVARAHHFGPAFLPLAIPAVASLIALFAARQTHVDVVAPPQEPEHQTSLPKVFWWYVAAAGLLACGFVDFALLAYHFQKTALARPAVIPLLYAGAMGVNGLTAMIFGKLFDRFGSLVLVLGILVSALSLPLGFLGGFGAAVAGVACWAAGMGVQDATLRSGIAQVVSMSRRGSAFGIFNGVFGVAWFLGSAVMGIFYDHSVTALVVFGMIAQIAAAILFFRLRKPLAAAMAGH